MNNWKPHYRATRATAFALMFQHCLVAFISLWPTVQYRLQLYRTEYGACQSRADIYTHPLVHGTDDRQVQPAGNGISNSRAWGTVDDSFASSLSGLLEADQQPIALSLQHGNLCIGVADQPTKGL